MSNNQVLNATTIEELKDIMGDEFTHLVETFLVDSVSRIATIKEAIANTDAEAVRRSAHSFKGSASNMGAEQLVAVCQKLERLGAEGDVDNAQSLLDDILTAYDKIPQALKAFC